MIYSCASHIGKVRSNNEDYCGGEIVEVDGNDQIGIFAIADGMGGHNKGEVASKLAVDNIIDFLKENLVQNNNVKLDYIDDIIKQAYNSVNHIIFNKSKEEIECEGMGTTLVTAVVYKDNLYIANVGDSRGYLSKEDSFEKITIDHSIVEELIRANVITEEEAKSHPRRNHITRAMGTDEMVIVDTFKCSIKNDDIVLLATDGLTGFVDEKDIISIINRDKNIEDISNDLIDIANNVSGRDNVSVVLIKRI